MAMLIRDAKPAPLPDPAIRAMRDAEDALTRRLLDICAAIRLGHISAVEARTEIRKAVNGLVEAIALFGCDLVETDVSANPLTLEK